MKTSAKPTGAFTLVELLVVIAIFVVLAVMLAPAFASTKDHAQRASCANNMRELGLGTAVYAEHYNGAYPITQAGNNPVNLINGGYYTRWVFFDGNKPNFHLSQSWDNYGDNPDSGAGGTSTGTFWRNFGMLYPERLAGDGSRFFCPGLNAKGSIMGAELYQPLLTTDTSGVNPGSVRSSYIYNPWVFGGNNRLYVKTSNLKSRVVFGLDFMDASIWNSDGSVKADSRDFSHGQACGWNVLFSDNSVAFNRTDRRVAAVVAANYPVFSNFNGYDIQGIDLLCGNIFEKQ